jgi:hypothetical protein
VVLPVIGQHETSAATRENRDNNATENESSVAYEESAPLARDAGDALVEEIAKRSAKREIPENIEDLKHKVWFELFPDDQGKSYLVALIVEHLRPYLREPKRESGKHQELGRFRHHPDAAIDFCCEVDFLEGRVRNVQCGMDTKDDVAKEIFRAMQFRCGGDAGAVRAKDRLRDLEATLNSIEDGARP